jgi:hypothetical protein
MITCSFTKPDMTVGNAWYVARNTVNFLNNTIVADMILFKDAASKDAGAVPMLTRGFPLPYSIAQQAVPNGLTGEQAIIGMVEQWLVANQAEFSGGTIS